jgi:hypothetical protein
LVSSNGPLNLTNNTLVVTDALLVVTNEGLVVTNDSFVVTNDSFVDGDSESPCHGAERCRVVSPSIHEDGGS